MFTELLQVWCDAICRLQISSTHNPRLDGGILCPACMRIHGRSGDAVYPLITLYRHTGDTKYLAAAERLFEWSENMVCADGSYYNDQDSTWRGITIFAEIGLGECLYYEGDILPEDFKKKLARRFRITAAYIYDHLDSFGGNVNYPITSAYAMILAQKLYPEDRPYREAAQERACNARHYILESGWLYGEGTPWEMITPKGCRPVDIAYNVEESIQSLALYAELSGDEETMQAALLAAYRHLEFMLPDGAWDDSMGSRSFKWAYWGSRTSDGCGAGFSVLAANDPVFAVAVYRNVELLRQCTGKEGLLYGGLMYEGAGEPPCVHHSICHAKMLASLVENEFEQRYADVMSKRNVLPSETAKGMRYYDILDTYRLYQDGWIATISGYDYLYQPDSRGVGGVISLLWHERTGPVLAAGMPEYWQIEPNNMQLPSVFEGIDIAARFEETRDNHVFSSNRDYQAVLHGEERENGLYVSVSGRLRDNKQTAAGKFSMKYALQNGQWSIYGRTTDRTAVFFLPVIAASNDVVEMDSSAQKIVIRRKQAVVVIESEGRMRMADNAVNDRIFHPVGGFTAMPLVISLSSGTVDIRIRVQDRATAKERGCRKEQGEI